MTCTVLQDAGGLDRLGAHTENLGLALDIASSLTTSCQISRRLQDYDAKGSRSDFPAAEISKFNALRAAVDALAREVAASQGYTHTQLALMILSKKAGTLLWGWVRRLPLLAHSSQDYKLERVGTHTQPHTVTHMHLHEIYADTLSPKTYTYTHTHIQLG